MSYESIPSGNQRVVPNGAGNGRTTTAPVVGPRGEPIIAESGLGRPLAQAGPFRVGQPLYSWLTGDLLGAIDYVGYIDDGSDSAYAVIGDDWYFRTDLGVVCCLTPPIVCPFYVGQRLFRHSAPGTRYLGALVKIARGADATQSRWVLLTDEHESVSSRDVLNLQVTVGDRHGFDDH